MALHLILGASGSGKSQLLYNLMIKESKKHPDKDFLVIVPEQYTMATQKKLVRLHPDHAIMQIDILSFQRLAGRVFAQLGLEDKTVLDDTGKNLIIRKIMERHRKELTAFAGSLDKNGFVSEVKSVISEFLQYCISPNDLPDIISSVASNMLLADKLSDIQTVYEAFMEYIQRDYITSEGVLGLLAQHAGSSGIIRGSIIAIDGFTGFTPVQYDLISRLLENAQDVYVTVTIGANEKINVRDGVENLFALSKETISSLLRIADEQRIKISPHIMCKESYRHKETQDLAFLEENLFRYNGRRYTKEPQHMRMYCGKNPKDEIKYAAAQILWLTRTQGLRYRDIAVVSADIENYGTLTANIFAQNNIPVFIDYKRSVMGNVMIEFVRSAINVIESGYSYESVFRFLRTGITGITKEETDILENYCLALGIRGKKKWNSQWDGNYLKKNRNKADLSILNELRYKVVCLLKPLEEGYESAGRGRVKVSGLLNALYTFIANAEIEKKMLALADKLENEGELAVASEYRQIYGRVMELFDKISALLGEEEVGKKEFTKIFDAGLEEIKLGLIPPSADCVLAGDMERTRLDNIKALFFVGVNDGIIPAKKENKGILSEMDRNILQNENVTLSPDAGKKIFIDRFYLYINMTKPSQRLYITYSLNSSDGKNLRPSYIIHMLLNMFPRMITDKYAGTGTDAWLTIPKAAKQWEQEDWTGELDEKTAVELYGDDVRESVTRLEQFASCEFSHFLKYGLDIAEREEYKIQASDTGSILHKSMERISFEMVKAGEDFAKMEDEKRNELVNRIVTEVAGEYGNSIFQNSSRSEYMIKKIKELADRTVWAIGKQLTGERFVPESFEVRFSLPVETSARKQTVNLIGSIDRIDICEDNENVYVKIIDYKTGNDKFALYKTYYGLKLQLMTYMTAAVEYEQKRHPDKNIIPAGAFYFGVDNPIVDADSDTANVEKAILKELSYDGLANDDIPEDILGSSKEVLKSDSHITTKQFDRLAEHIGGKISEMTDSMIGGASAVNPVADGNTNSCTYCSYRSVCGFYSDLPGKSLRRIKYLKDSKVWEELFMEREGTPDGENMDGGTEEGDQTPQ